MFFRRAPKWRRTFKTCDHRLASSALIHYLTENTPSPGLAAALEAYFSNPNYDSALGVVAVEPDLVLLFRECRPGGVYHTLGLEKPTRR